ncbi:MAG: hypothetical protein AAB592_02250 [Patescibacteria group bacterium]
MSYITILEAATISGKSIQTIRRMIKRKKLHTKKQKTPQGFNYLVEKDSLNQLGSSDYSLDNTDTQQAHGEHDMASHSTIHSSSRDHRSLNNDFDFIRSELSQFNGTVQKLITQNERDKQSFFELIKTFQERIVVLENEIKQLEAPQNKKWWELW